MNVCICACMHACRGPWSSEEGVISLELEFQAVVSILTIGAGTEPRSSEEQQAA